MKIENVNGAYTLTDGVSWIEEQTGELQEVFRDGKLVKQWTLAQIRERVKIQEQVVI